MLCVHPAEVLMSLTFPFLPTVSYWNCTPSRFFLPVNSFSTTVCLWILKTFTREPFRFFALSLLPLTSHEPLRFAVKIELDYPVRSLNHEIWAFTNSCSITMVMWCGSFPVTAEEKWLRIREHTSSLLLLQIFQLSVSTKRIRPLRGSASHSCCDDFADVPQIVVFLLPLPPLSVALVLDYAADII